MPSATPTFVDNYDSGSASGSMSVDTTGGLMEFSETGLYMLYVSVSFSTNFTGTALGARIQNWDQTEHGPNQVERTTTQYGSVGFSMYTAKLAIVTALGSPDNAWSITLDQDSGSNRSANEVAFRGVRLADLP